MKTVFPNSCAFGINVTGPSSGFLVKPDVNQLCALKSPSSASTFWTACKNAGYLVSLSFRLTANYFLQSEFVPNMLFLLLSRVKNHCLGLEPPMYKDHNHWRLHGRADVEIRIGSQTEQPFICLSVKTG